MNTDRLIENYERPFVVEVGRPEYEFDFTSKEPILRSMDWSFHRAYRDLSEAQDNAERLSAFEEFVRVIEKDKFYND